MIAPSGVPDTSERKQLLVGMPQVWSDSDGGAGKATGQLLISLQPFTPVHFCA